MSRGGSSCSSAVAGGLAVLLAAMMAVTAEAGSRSTERTLVLAGGQSVPVADAEVLGDTVMVTRLDGRRVAVEADRIDLDASGLGAPAGRFGSRPGLVELDRLDRDAGGTSITDADVGHVGPGAAEPGTGAAPAGAGEPGVRVSGVRHHLSGSIATVSGQVTNTSPREVADLLIEVAAMAADRSQLGHAATSLGEPLPPGASRRFSLPVRVGADPAAIRVFVSGPVGKVVFDVDDR